MLPEKLRQCEVASLEAVMKIAYLLVLASMIQSTVARAAPPSGLNPPLVIGERRNGGVARLRMGRDIEVRLGLRPDGKFEWVRREVPSVLKQVGNVEIVTDPKFPKLPRGQVFRFKTLAAGTGTLSFGLFSRSTHRKAPAQTFKVIVTVLAK